MFIATSTFLTIKLGKPVQKLPEEVSITLGGTADELYNALALRAGISVHRLRVTKGSDGALVPNRKDLELETTGLREQSTIYVKDLGASSLNVLQHCLCCGFWGVRAFGVTS